MHGGEVARVVPRALDVGRVDARGRAFEQFAAAAVEHAEARGRPEVLLAGSENELAMHNFFPMFDVSSDGQTLLIFRDDESGETAPPQLQAVFRWFDELSELVPLVN